MGNKIWKFELDHWEQSVEIEYGFFSGVKTIYVDGALIEKRKQDTFRIREHECSIATKDSLISSQYDLVVDGRIVGGGQEIKEQKGSKIPVWAWIFVLACGSIPIISLGGAIPGAIGFGGAAGCVSVARSPNIPTALSVVLCIVITVICWSLFALLIWQTATSTLF